jgi:hypothetical protein
VHRSTVHTSFDLEPHQIVDGDDPFGSLRRDLGRNLLGANDDRMIQPVKLALKVWKLEAEIVQCAPRRPDRISLRLGHGTYSKNFFIGASGKRSSIHPATVDRSADLLLRKAAEFLEFGGRHAGQQ